MIFGPYAAQVHPDVCHDGDTVFLNVLLRPGRRPLNEDLDLGFGLHLRHLGLWLVRLSVRLEGCDAPELSTAAGKAAHAYMRTLLMAGDRVAFTSSGWDKFGGRADGRILVARPHPVAGSAEVWQGDLAARMIEAGHAKPWDGRGRRP